MMQKRKRFYKDDVHVFSKLCTHLYAILSTIFLPACNTTFVRGNKSGFPSIHEYIYIYIYIIFY